MVHSHPQKDNTLPQFRDQGADRPAGPAPRPNEVIGHGRKGHAVRGLDALTPILAHVAFPASKTEVIEAIGQVRVPIDRVATKSVREIVEMTAPETFATSDDLTSAIAHVWDRIQPHYEDGRGAHHHQQR